MQARYFAYGSNLSRARLEERVAGVDLQGVAWLEGYRLCWDKRGADGSGKANLLREPGSGVWGVLYTFPAPQILALDAHEPRYLRIDVEVRVGGARLPAQTYLSEHRTASPPYDWYKRLVVDGAREHGLPSDWIAALEAAPTLVR
ncbi:MAG: gamma-glutamylcyclotransferase family protein [Myxococcota bacterium]